MRLHVQGEGVEGSLDAVLVARIRYANTEPAEEVGSEGIRGEETVQVAADDAAVGAHGTFGRALNEREWTSPIGTIGTAEVDLVAFDRKSAGGCNGRDTLKALVRAQHGRHVEKAEALRLTGRALDTQGIGDAPAQHLISAADAKHSPPTPPVRKNVDVPALRTQ